MKQITCNFCGDTYPDFDVAHVCSKGPYAPRLKSKMNERIRQLAEQAGYDWAWNTQIDFGHEEMELFAELIVGECMRMCDVAAIGYESHGHMKEANGCYSAKEYIEEHFGVEE